MAAEGPAKTHDRPFRLFVNVFKNASALQDVDGSVIRTSFLLIALMTFADQQGAWLWDVDHQKGTMTLYATIAFGVGSTSFQDTEK